MTKMPQRPEKPPRGRTFDPWPCCGVVEEGRYGRMKTAVICADCRKLMTLGQDAKAKADEEIASGSQQPYWFVERAYAYPYIDAPHRYGHDSLESLRQAFYNLVWAVGNSAEGQPPHSPNRVRKRTPFGAEFEDWLPVIDNDSMQKHSAVNHPRDWRKLVMLNPAVRDLINALDAVVRDAVAEAFQTGKEQGAAILFGLASGEKSLDEFDLALKTPEERANAERQRR